MPGMAQALVSLTVRRMLGRTVEVVPVLTDRSRRALPKEWSFTGPPGADARTTS
jgi:hypothetical protein